MRIIPKMKLNAKRQEGRILVLILVTVFALSAFWFIALSMTGTELQRIGGKSSAAQQFFDAEAGLNAAMEEFDVLYNALTGDITTAVATLSPTDPTSGGRVVAAVTLRPIQDVDASLAQSYGLPVQAHRFRPPAGSGSGVNTARAMRYGINAASGSKEIQVGVYRIVPK